MTYAKLTPQPSAASKSGIYWTQFPATAMTGVDGDPVDWTDHRAAHRAVSRLFPPKLPGASNRRRATSAILFRRDAVSTDSDSVILVQSLVRPELTPEESRTTEVSARAWECLPGERVVFRVAVNPVRRRTLYYTDSSRSVLRAEQGAVRGPDGKRDRSTTRQVATVIPVDEIAQWVSTQLAAGLGDLQVVSHFSDTTYSGSGTDRHKLVIHTLEGLATVVDPHVLNQLRIDGIGREKSYGCGLLTIARQSPAGARQ